MNRGAPEQSGLLPKSVWFPVVRISGETAAAGVITPDVNFIEDTKKNQTQVISEPMSILIRPLALI